MRGARMRVRCALWVWMCTCGCKGLQQGIRVLLRMRTRARTRAHARISHGGRKTVHSGARQRSEVRAGDLLVRVERRAAVGVEGCIELGTGDLGHLGKQSEP